MCTVVVCIKNNEILCGERFGLTRRFGLAGSGLVRTDCIVTNTLAPLITTNAKIVLHMEVQIHINGRAFIIEVDTEAAVLIISEVTRKSHFSDIKLHSSKHNPKTDTEEPRTMVGN